MGRLTIRLFIFTMELATRIPAAVVVAVAFLMALLPSLVFAGGCDIDPFYPTCMVGVIPPTNETWTAMVRSHAHSSYPIPDTTPASTPQGSPWAPGATFDGREWNTERSLNTELAACGKGKWAFTVDDGPSAVTREFLDVLKYYNVTATFFTVGANLVGANAGGTTADLRAAFNAGHQIGYHTWTHPQLTTLTTDQIVAEIIWNAIAVYKAIGLVPRYLRPPYGDIDDRLRNILLAMNLRPVLWTVATDDVSIGEDGYGQIDGNSYNQDRMNERIRSTVKDGYQPENPWPVKGPFEGHISLQHDLRKVNVESAKQITPLVVGDLSASSDGTVNGGAPYGKFKSVPVVECELYGDRGGPYLRNGEWLLDLVRTMAPGVQEPPNYGVGSTIRSTTTRLSAGISTMAASSTIILKRTSAQPSATASASDTDGFAAFGSKDVGNFFSGLPSKPLLLGGMIAGVLLLTLLLALILCCVRRRRKQKAAACEEKGAAVGVGAAAGAACGAAAAAGAAGAAASALSEKSDAATVAVIDDEKEKKKIDDVVEVAATTAGKQKKYWFSKKEKVVSSKSSIQELLSSSASEGSATASETGSSSGDGSPSGSMDATPACNGATAATVAAGAGAVAVASAGAAALATKKKSPFSWFSKTSTKVQETKTTVSEKVEASADSAVGTVTESGFLTADGGKNTATSAASSSPAATAASAGASSGTIPSWARPLVAVPEGPVAALPPSDTLSAMDSSSTPSRPASVANPAFAIAAAATAAVAAGATGVAVAAACGSGNGKKTAAGSSRPVSAVVSPSRPLSTFVPPSRPLSALVPNNQSATNCSANATGKMQKGEDDDDKPLGALNITRIPSSPGKRVSWSPGNPAFEAAAAGASSLAMAAAGRVDSEKRTGLGLSLGSVGRSNSAASKKSAKKKGKVTATTTTTTTSTTVTKSSALKKATTVVGSVCETATTNTGAIAAGVATAAAATAVAAVAVGATTATAATNTPPPRILRRKTITATGASSSKDASAATDSAAVPARPFSAYVSETERLQHEQRLSDDKGEKPDLPQPRPANPLAEPRPLSTDPAMLRKAFAAFAAASGFKKQVTVKKEAAEGTTAKEVPAPVVEELPNTVDPNEHELQQMYGQWLLWNQGQGNEVGVNSVEVHTQQQTVDLKQQQEVRVQQQSGYQQEQLGYQEQQEQQVQHHQLGYQQQEQTINVSADDAIATTTTASKFPTAAVATTGLAAAAIAGTTAAGMWVANASNTRRETSVVGPSTTAASVVSAPSEVSNISASHPLYGFELPPPPMGPPPAAEQGVPELRIVQQTGEAAVVVGAQQAEVGYPVQARTVEMVTVVEETFDKLTMGSRRPASIVSSVKRLDGQQQIGCAVQGQQIGYVAQSQQQGYPDSVQGGATEMVTVIEETYGKSTMGSRRPASLVSSVRRTDEAQPNGYAAQAQQYAVQGQQYVAQGGMTEVVTVIEETYDKSTMGSRRPASVVSKASVAPGVQLAQQYALQGQQYHAQGGMTEVVTVIEETFDKSTLGSRRRASVLSKKSVARGIEGAQQHGYAVQAQQYAVQGGMTEVVTVIEETFDKSAMGSKRPSSVVSRRSVTNGTESTQLAYPTQAQQYSVQTGTTEVVTIVEETFDRSTLGSRRSAGSASSFRRPSTQDLPAIVTSDCATDRRHGTLGSTRRSLPRTHGETQRTLPRVPTEALRKMHASQVDEEPMTSPVLSTGEPVEWRDETSVVEDKMAAAGYGATAAWGKTWRQGKVVETMETVETTTTTEAEAAGKAKRTSWRSVVSGGSGVKPAAKHLLDILVPGAAGERGLLAPSTGTGLTLGRNGKSSTNMTTTTFKSAISDGEAMVTAPTSPVLTPELPVLGVESLLDGVAKSLEGLEMSQK
ncbi:chitin deacetylase [Phlyctochytrium bullatum]|nr:chitin deacetylase [Phlyctochytrium bullatum]